MLLSWSGHSSHDVALALREWLPQVLPGCAPWVSSEDIAKGQRWSDALHESLKSAKATIVCITPENVKSPWLYYEAGQVAARIGQAAVCPYLVGVQGKLVTGTPLGLYQWTEADKTDTWKLIRALHGLLGSPHDAGMLEGNFQSKWPQLRRKLDKVAEGFEAIEDEVTAVEKSIAQQLTEEAKQMLAAACGGQDDRAVVTRLNDLVRDRIIAGGRQFVAPNNARSAALWKGALNELEQFGLVEPLGHERELFEVTRKGWEVYDQLGPLFANAPPPEPPPAGQPSGA